MAKRVIILSTESLVYKVSDTQVIKVNEQFHTIPGINAKFRADQGNIFDSDKHDFTDEQIDLIEKKFKSLIAHNDTRFSFLSPEEYNQFLGVAQPEAKVKVVVGPRSEKDVAGK